MKKSRQRDGGPVSAGYGVGLEEAGPQQVYDEDFESGEQDAIRQNFKGVFHQTDQGEGVMPRPDGTRQVKSRQPLQGEGTTHARALNQELKTSQRAWSILREQERASEKTLGHPGLCTHGKPTGPQGHAITTVAVVLIKGTATCRQKRHGPSTITMTTINNPGSAPLRVPSPPTKSGTTQYCKILSTLSLTAVLLVPTGSLGTTDRDYLQTPHSSLLVDSLPSALPPPSQDHYLCKKSGRGLPWQSSS
ncbi:hypothetical protein MJG53_012016 [Ovis ammon polii x Ovis aries]|uniref:Uncharacterized protein n=1 Tax=Ovis ammon polii x Ovis aries TaxID=2918886 RepID=A0ACB9UQP9_9CETA|nr:hypothetical protein MJG53_012016 [Ovis ammon polii x Ovis aries]